MNQSLLVELLDTELRHTIQTWTFDSDSPFHIGRSADADVVIRNPYVSRTHVYVSSSDSGWNLVSISDLGVIIDGKTVRTAEFEDSVEFQLARKGPLMRVSVCSSVPGDSFDAKATIGEEAFNIPMLILDERKRDEEVSAIENQDFFGRLQDIATNLKRKNDQGRT